MIDFQATAKAAARANAAYVIGDAGSKAAFEALGDVWIAQYSTDSVQAALSADAQGNTHLSISGTRASAFRVMDVLDDMFLKPVSVEGGSVTAGVIKHMQSMWDWALQIIPSGDVINVAGHSLGGSRTHLTPLFVPLFEQIGQLHSFEAPKFADAAFYAHHALALSDMVCVLNGADLWAAYPWRNPQWCARPQTPHIWLKDDLGAFEIIPGAQWPGGADPADHDMDRVQARLDKIAAATAEPEAA